MCTGFGARQAPSYGDRAGWNLITKHTKRTKKVVLTPRRAKPVRKSVSTSFGRRATRP